MRAISLLVMMLRMVLNMLFNLIERLCDMIESGVVDSFAVVKTIL